MDLAGSIPVTRSRGTPLLKGSFPPQVGDRGLPGVLAGVAEILVRWHCLCGKPEAKRLISGGTGFRLIGKGWASDGYSSD